MLSYTRTGEAKNRKGERRYEENGNCNTDADYGGCFYGVYGPGQGLRAKQQSFGKFVGKLETGK